MNEDTTLKTISYTPFNYSADRALFRVNGGVPIQEALERASHFLLKISKAVIDDVVKVITPRPEVEVRKKAEKQ